MIRQHVPAPAKLLLRVLAAVILASLLALALPDGAASHEDPEKTPTPTQTSEAQQPIPTETPQATATPEPTSTQRPRPTATATATATPLPAQDVAVAFFNNFCAPGQPLLATIFNTSATPLESRTLRLQLYTENGLVEEHDHFVSLPPFGTMNLPFLHPAEPPWVKVEISLVDGPADPNPGNDSVICGVADPEATAGTSTESGDDGDFELPDLSPGTSSSSAPPPASGLGSGSVWRQVAPTPTQAPPPTPEPSPAQTGGTTSSPPRSNDPQPALTPIGDAGGGLAGESGGAFPSRALMTTGIVLLAAGTSWAFYYLTRPPRNA